MPRSFVVGLVNTARHRHKFEARIPGAYRPFKVGTATEVAQAICRVDPKAQVYRSSDLDFPEEFGMKSLAVERFFTALERYCQPTALNGRRRRR